MTSTPPIPVGAAPIRPAGGRRVPSPVGRAPSPRAMLAAGLVLALAAAALVAALEPPRSAGRERAYTIAAGSAQRVRSGESIDEVLPQRLETAVGDVLVVRNDDVESHVLGPFLLAPGQSWSRTYALAGDYAMTCSLYPTGGLVVSVLPATGPAGLADRARRAAVLIVLVLAVATTAAVAWTLAGSPSGIVARTAALVPGAVVAAVALEAVALSRAAPWRSALGSRALGWWLAALVAAAAVPALVSLAGGERRLRAALLVAATVAASAAAALTAWTWLGPVAVGLAPVAAGLGLLTAAAVTDGSREHPDPPVTGLAVVGLALVASGLPWPWTEPPQIAARGLAVLALAGVAALPARDHLGGRRRTGGWAEGAPGTASAPEVASAADAEGAPGAASAPAAASAPDAASVPLAATATAVPDAAGVPAIPLAAAAFLGAFGLALAWSGTTAHVAATAVPAAGNPVEADAPSIERGRRTWAVHCASCHPTVPASTDPTDRAVMRLLANGDRDHRFAYVLSLRDRGDVAHFMRAAGP